LERLVENRVDIVSPGADEAVRRPDADIVTTRRRLESVRVIDHPLAVGRIARRPNAGQNILFGDNRKRLWLHTALIHPHSWMAYIDQPVAVECHVDVVELVADLVHESSEPLHIRVSSRNR
jgi:hypothetical protein